MSTLDPPKEFSRPEVADILIEWATGEIVSQEIANDEKFKPRVW